MKIILHVADDDTDPNATEDTTAYVHSLKSLVERRQHQGYPGAVLNHGDGAIWVTNVEILLDTGPAQE